MEEIWKDISGYEGIYQVSSLGRVRSLDRIGRQGRFLHGQILRGYVGRQGYRYVTLKDGKAREKTMKVHRLVATAFIKNPNNFPQINHKDENKTNNHVDNLEWCTQSYNMNYGTALERAASKTRNPVAQLSQNGFLIAVYAGMNVASDITGISESKISMCCSGKRNCAGGFIWKPLYTGSTVIIDGQRYLAADTGVSGLAVDVCMEDHAATVEAGVQRLEVWVEES